MIVVLDNQKTFRIFENLFVNIQKYAMPQSRVYVQVHTSGEAPEEFVEITIKNMSATELNFDPEEITERFVRGDTSRGRLGSGTCDCQKFYRGAGRKTVNRGGW